MPSKIKIPVAGDRDVELESNHILCDNVILPGEYNPHNVRLWIVGNEFGAMGAVWASCEQDALDALVNADLGAGILVDQEEERTEEEKEDLTPLGNAGELADLSYCILTEVPWRPNRPDGLSLLLKFAEARGKGADTLDDL